jgi:hypothetical protein
MTTATSDLRKNSGKFSVYALSDPETDELRYVGMTIKKLEVRLNNHCSEANRKPSASHRTRWLRSVTSRGLRPKIELVEELPDATSMAEAEEYWITQFRAMGFRLVNGNGGGWGGPSKPHSEGLPAETRAKISKSLMGKKQSPESIEKRVAHLRGVKTGPQPRQKTINHAMAIGRGPFQDEEGEVFYLIKDAAKKHKIHYTTVVSSLRGRPIHGHAFAYIKNIADKEHPPQVIAPQKPDGLKLSRSKLGKSRPEQLGRKESEETIAKKKAANLGKILRARPFTDGQRVFQTLGEAAQHFQVGRAQIRNCLRGQSSAINLWHVTHSEKDVGL